MLVWQPPPEYRDHQADLSNSVPNSRLLSDTPSSVSTTDFALPTGLSIIPFVCPAAEQPRIAQTRQRRVGAKENPRPSGLQHIGRDCGHMGLHGPQDLARNRPLCRTYMFSETNETRSKREPITMLDGVGGRH